MERAFQESRVGDKAGLPVREGTGGRRDPSPAGGHSRPRSDRMRWGLRTQQGPQPLHIPPTVIHLVAGIEAAPARPPRPVQEPRGQESGNEGAVFGAARSRISPGGSGAAATGTGLQRDFCSKEAAGPSLWTYQSHVALWPRGWRGEGPQCTW